MYVPWKNIEMKKILGYLDHNILDSIRKGDVFNIRELLTKNQITPVYSHENLKEIKRSVGSENEFIALLDELGAEYIEPIHDNGLPTGIANIYDNDVFSVWTWFLENDDPMPEYGYGLSAMLEKFYGGRAEESYSDIFSNGTEELRELLSDALNELDSSEFLTNEMKLALEVLPDLLKDQYKQISEDLDSQTQSPVKGFENATNLGAKVLKNIKGPEVVEKIFAALQESLPLVDGESPITLEIDQFFGIKSQPHEPNSDREKTLSEKVNGIYHQLNFLGYYRDSDMKKSRGFVRSSSDMTHAGLASFCHLLLCRDEGLVMKASAAYEYLGVRTKILHFQANKSIQPTASASAD